MSLLLDTHCARLTRANVNKKREWHASMQTLFVFLKVAVQCHTGHCSATTRFVLSQRSVAPPSFTSSNAEWITPDHFAPRRNPRLPTSLLFQVLLLLTLRHRFACAMIQSDLSGRAVVSLLPAVGILILSNSPTSRRSSWPQPARCCQSPSVLFFFRLPHFHVPCRIVGAVPPSLPVRCLHRR